jgi:hypothetical protein
MYIYLTKVNNAVPSIPVPTSSALRITLLVAYVMTASRYQTTCVKVLLSLWLPGALLFFVADWPPVINVNICYYYYFTKLLFT